MNLNSVVYNYLSDRELNIGKSFDSRFYSKKIIKSYYRNCHNLKKLVIKSKCRSALLFSQDDKYVGQGDSIWVLKDDFYLNESNKILTNQSISSLPYHSLRVKSFNVDSSKIFGFFSTHPSTGFWIAVKDISRNEFIFKTTINNQYFLISNCPLNPDLFSYSNQETIKIKDLRSQDAQEIKYKAKITSLQYNPVKDYLLLVNSKGENGFHVLDLRNFKPSLTYHVLYTNDNLVSQAVYNKSGSEIVIRKTGYNPLLYKSDEIYPTHEFDDFGYFDYIKNHIHIDKKICFAGPDDEYIVATSDNHKDYIWEIPRKNFMNVKDGKATKKVNKAKFVLHNKFLTSSVAYNYQRSVLACSGLKFANTFWSPFKFENKTSYKKKNLFEPSFTFYDLIEWDFKEYVFRSFCLDNVESNFLTKNYSFEDKNPENTLKEDMSLIYIRSFINDYNTSEVFKDLHLISSLKKTLNKQIKFKTKFYHDDYLSVFFQTYKVFLRKSLIEKSILYVQSKASNLEKSLKSMSVLDEAHLKPAYSKKIKIIEETIISLNLMSNSLSKILEKNEVLYNDPKEILKKLTKLFVDCPKSENSTLLEDSFFKNTISKTDNNNFL